MSRPRDYLEEPGLILHAYNRGVDGRRLFPSPRGYEMFMQKLFEARERTNVSILLHTLMPTHFHLMLQQHEPFAISKFMQRVCCSFSHWTNKRLKRTGPLYDSPYGGTPVPDPKAFLHISNYILKNPAQAGLVRDPEQWRYSSCEALLRGSNGDFEDHSLILGLVGGTERLAVFLEKYNSADPMSIGEYLCPDYDKTWEIRTSGEYLRYEQEELRKKGSTRDKRG